MDTCVELSLDDGTCQAFSQDEIVLGSSALSDFVIPPFFGIQNRHAMIRRIASRWIVESEGDWLLYVDDASPSNRHWLIDGQQINLAERGPTLHFQLAPGAAEASQSPISSPTKCEPSVVASAPAKPVSFQTSACGVLNATDTSTHIAANGHRPPHHAKNRRHRNESSEIKLILTIIKPILGAILGLLIGYLLVCRLAPNSALIRAIKPHMPNNLQPDALRGNTADEDTSKPMP